MKAKFRTVTFDSINKNEITKKSDKITSLDYWCENLMRIIRYLKKRRKFYNNLAQLKKLSRPKVQINLLLFAISRRFANVVSIFKQKFNFFRSNAENWKFCLYIYIQYIYIYIYLPHRFWNLIVLLKWKYHIGLRFEI